MVRPFAQLTLTHVKAAQVSGGATAKAMEDEGRRLQAACPARSWRVALSEDGVRMDSRAFSAWMARRLGNGQPLAMMVGGAHGLAPGLKRGCGDIVSLSSLTFAHDLALTVLLEQIYRAFTILRGHPYHK
jgi:23S rRNA (pseudouridine1915-N3)-methyltransferase